MKRILSILSIALVGLMSISCYDDTGVWESLSGHEERIKNLEDKVAAMNSDLESLQDLAEAISGGDYVKEVTPLVEDGVEVGYKITFPQRGTVIIYHGKDGEDSDNAPKIGIEADEDGVYYWTVNGAWILDNAGNKIPASAQGVTPQLKIENEKWYVSYDNGESWEEMGAAVAETIPCVFAGVEVVDNILVVTLADGTVLSIPVGAPFRIVLGELPVGPFKYDTPVEVSYSIEGLTDSVTVFALSNHWMFRVELEEETATSGKLIIAQDDYMEREFNGKVALFATNESGLTISKVISVTSGVFHLSEGDYWYDLQGDATEFSVTVASNLDYEIEITDDWVALAETKAVEEKTYTFNVDANPFDEWRTTRINFVSGNLSFDIYVNQSPAISEIEVNLVANEYSSYGMAEVDLTQLVDQNGKSIKDALGYYSWEELRLAIGDWDQMYGMFNMPVSILGFYPASGDFIYDQYNTIGAGYWLDAYGYPSAWAAEEARTFWEIYPYDPDIDDSEPENFKMNTGVMPGNISVGDVYQYGVAFVRNDMPAQVRILVTITVEKYVDPEEIVLWEGEVISEGWSGVGLLSDAGIELKEAGAAVGQVVNFYIEPLVTDWQLKIFEGHWGSTYMAVCSSAVDVAESDFVIYDLEGNGGKVSLILTQEILDAALTQQWWGNTFIIMGNNVKCTKITLL